MCGIWAFMTENTCDPAKFESFSKIEGRGPDQSSFTIQQEEYYIGFHRLSIMDQEKGDQPFKFEENGKRYTCICNGEIYNAEILKKAFVNYYPYKSSSDCEILIPMYLKFGADMIDYLDGVFCFIIIEDTDDGYSAFICRDRIGVRPLFIGFNNNEIGFSSEIKGLTDLCETIEVFSPGKYMIIENGQIIKEEIYYSVKSNNTEFYNSNYELIVKQLLIDAVHKRLISDRPVCALLSGGLDSSLVCAIASKKLQEEGKKLYTFSIGMQDCTDDKYANMVAEHIGSIHTNVLITKEEALNSIRDVIYATETFDITTIRASVGQYLVSKYISDNTDFKVVLSGDGSDEVASGYMYNHLAPNVKELHKEAEKRVEEIHLYDALRADRATSFHGLELRVPFLDSTFVDYYLKINPLDRIPTQNRMEKYILRNIFSKDNLLPEEVLWRTKEAFSDGISSEEESWHMIIANHVEEKVELDDKFKHCSPKTKEAYYYREIFSELFGDKFSNVIPNYWMPNWTNTDDPSARELVIKKEITSNINTSVDIIFY